MRARSQAGRFVTAVAAAGLTGALITACDSSDSAQAEAASKTTHTASHSASDLSKQVALHNALTQLWGQHMEWTYMTVDAFFHDQKALTPTLNRLLKNQRDIGEAIAAYYGKDAGDQLAKLLTEHINGAVPVLQAAKAGDASKLKSAQAAWLANAKQVAGFLSAASPEQWPASATEPMLTTHISTTTTYAVDLLKGNYAKAIQGYDKAERHMFMLADVLAKGLIAQFPERFR